jgi:hypothetical protein
MPGKTKMTGFARFFILMLFVVPIAYIGASYYNGQDGIQNIKNLLGIESSTSGNAAESKSDDGFSLFSKKGDKGLEALKTENADLKEIIREQDLEIAELKRQIRLLQRK